MQSNPEPKTEYLLPDQLHSGDKIVTKFGHSYTIVRASLQSGMDEPYLRLRSERGIIGNRLWTRDDLQNEGVKLVNE